MDRRPMSCRERAMHAITWTAVFAIGLGMAALIVAVVTR